MSRIPVGVRRQVLKRDHFRCLAPVLDRDSGQCRDRFGRPTWEVPVEELELDHVRPEAMIGKEPPSEPQFLVTLCGWHHRGLASGRNWATRNRPMLREYLRGKAGPVSDPGVQLAIPDFPADEPPVRAMAGARL